MSKYPLLFWQPTHGPVVTGRMRIIYPSGRAEWNGAIPIRSYTTVDIERFSNWNSLPCWHRRNKTVSQLIQLMNDYDKILGFPPAVFLGEIK